MDINNLSIKIDKNLKPKTKNQNQKPKPKSKTKSTVQQNNIKLINRLIS